ncbi:MAG: FAD/NAD(P)-binding protein [Minwuia sp.]|uniref:FAD/NAD(P)-binding protein n=1 Tax=Minwuia sp. TaxID=2493630 RepID=UPI003A874201
MPRRIVIAGGGYSGAAAAIRLANSATAPLEITVVEPRARAGCGTAYDVSDPAVRLNVEDSLMVVDREDIGKFARWLDESGTRAADPDGVTDEGEFFAQRQAFGRFMAAAFAEAQKENRSLSAIRHYCDGVSALVPAGSGYRVQLGKGGAMEADLVILACGNERPASLPVLSEAFRRHSGYAADPWGPGTLDAIGPGERVLLVGSGLTAVDMIASLTLRGHTGRIDSVSRRGLLPRQQGEFPGVAELLRRIAAPVPALVEKHGRPSSVLEVLRWIRADMREDAARGVGWREGFDSIRDAARHIWPHLPVEEKRRFFRHLKPWYDCHRFRVAPQINRIVRTRLDDGSLTVSAARIVDAAAGEQGLTVTLQDRGQAEVRKAVYDRVINCTGPNPDPARSGIGFLREAMQSGLLAGDPSGVGLAVNDRYETLAPDGSANPALIAIGPMTKGRFGESVAVPQITLQLATLTARLTEEGLL